MTRPATFGLSHVAMKVRDLDRAAAFYAEAFGAREYYRDEKSVQLLGPGPHDVLAFELMPEGAGAEGGLMHFGLRLTAPEMLEGLLERALAAGATLRERGDFGGGQPFAFVTDPDGYEIELWYEKTEPHAQD